MEPEQKEQAESKRPYDPPRMTEISLRPEEAVLGHCKIAGQSSQPAGICGVTCFDGGS